MPLGETRCDPFRGIALGKDGKAEEGTLLRQATRVGQVAQTAFTTISGHICRRPEAKSTITTMANLIVDWGNMGHLIMINIKILIQGGRNFFS